jgi:hypothetical protein
MEKSKRPTNDEAVDQFMLTEFQAANSRRAMHMSSMETLLNIHLTVVSIGAGGLVTLWTQQHSGNIRIVVTIVALIFLLILGQIIQYRITVHDGNIRWDGYRYRLAEQFFIDKYPASKIDKFTAWPDKPEKRLSIHRGSFGRSLVGITATVSCLVLGSLAFSIAVLSNVQLWIGITIALLISILGWYLQRWIFHRGAKKIGLILMLNADPPIKRKDNDSEHK